MPRRRETPGIDPFADLAKKIEILEREMAVQAAALDKLKQMGARDTGRPDTHPVRRTA